MKKLTLEKIRQEFKNDGYKVLSKEYKEAHSPIECKCPKGHVVGITWSRWKKGHRCRICGIIRRTDRQRIPFNIIKNQFENEKYQLLTTEYKRVGQNLEFICPKGHRSKISYTSWQQGHRCRICGRAICSEKQRLDYSFVKESFEKEGYKLLSATYINNNTPLEFQCPNGHIRDIRWINWQRGSRCLDCNSDRLGNLYRKPFEEIQQEFQKEGYKLVSTYYKNNRQNLSCICPNNHLWKVAWSNFRKGDRCPVCGNGTSKAELEIFELVRYYFPDTIQRDRTLISPQELDIVIPSKKLAIEYCGTYWHSELNGKTKTYHLNKLKECNKIGFQLITVFEDEWTYKKDIVINRLKHILQLNSDNRIYARKCEIREIDSSTKAKFLNIYHIQGSDNSTIRLGAYYKDELVAVMTFATPSIAKGNKSIENTYELSRFCTSCNVVGIASKILKYFTNNYSPKSIFSYADRRWSDGNLYYKLGFKFEHNTQPNYWYIDAHHQKRIHRFNYRKSVLPAKLDKFDPNLTEWQNMVNNNHDRIWDCGNIKFVINF